jgi:type II secretory pathway component PulJ
MRGAGPTSERSNEAGFTLVELVVGIALMATVMGLCVSMYSAISGKSRWGGEQASRLDMTSRGLAALRHDLQRVQRMVVRVKDKDQFLFAGKRSEVSFAVFDPAYPTDAGSYVVTYAIRKQGGQAQVLRTRVAHELADERGRRSSRGRQTEEDVVVLEGAYDFTFAYLERAEGKSTWVDTWTQSARLPELIRFAAKSTQAGVPHMPVLIVEPRINGEFTCVMPQVGLCSPQTAGALVDRKSTATSGPPRQP